MKIAIRILALLSIPALASANTLRCGSQIIMVGSSSAELQALCGAPAQVSNGSIYGGPGAGRGSNVAAVEEQVETWTYNFGPNQLMQRIRIENGVVAQIDSLGYGYDEP
jgi:hypothetical protein